MLIKSSFYIFRTFHCSINSLFAPAVRLFGPFSLVSLASSLMSHQPPNIDLERLSSETSIGFVEPSASDLALKEPPGQSFLCNVESEGYCIPKDTICVAVVCNDHHRIALQCQPNKAHFLPCVQESLDEMPIETVLRDLLKQIIPMAKGLYQYQNMST